MSTPETETEPEPSRGEDSEVSKALISQLDEGELVSVGGFTLDQTKAVAKLGAYRLADPNTFLLLFVEAAVLFNCTQIEIEQDSQDTRVRLVGVWLDDDELRRLPDAPFANARPDAPLEARRLDAKRALAFGLVTATNLRGARSALHSEGPEGAWSLQVAPGGAVELAQVDTAKHTPQLRLVLRESPGVVARARGDDDDRTALRQRIIATRCRHAPIIVRIAGKRHDRLRSTPEFEPGARNFEVEGVRGRVGRAPVRRKATIVFVTNGVVIEEVELDGLRPGIAAVVDASALARDLSLFRLRRDESFDHIVTVTRAQLERVSPVEDELVPRRLPGAVDQASGGVGGLRVVGWVFLAMALIPVYLSVLVGNPIGFVVGLVSCAIGSSCLRAAQRRTRRQLVEQGGILGLATIEYVISGGDPLATQQYEGQPRHYQVRAQVQAPGIPTHVQTLSLVLPPDHEPLVLNVPYYARLDPAGKAAAVIEHGGEQGVTGA